MGLNVILLVLGIVLVLAAFAIVSVPISLACSLIGGALVGWNIVEIAFKV